MAVTTFNAALLTPKTTIRYEDTTRGRTTAIVLKDMSILEVKRNGVSAKTHYVSFNDWLATLPEGAEMGLQVNAVPVRSAATHPVPTTDIGLMDLVTKKNIIRYAYSLTESCAIAKKQMEDNKLTRWNNYFTTRYNYYKGRIDNLGGPESEAANYSKIRMCGKPLWVLSTDGSKPEALFFGNIPIYDRERMVVNYSDTPYFFYKGKQGTTFIEAGVPVNPETGWPNLWRLYNNNEFKPIAKPV